VGTQIRGSQIKQSTVAADRLVGTDIATVGTITTGTWNGSVIGVSYLDSSLATQSYVGNEISALNLGTMSTQSSSNVSITGGSISGITDLAVADGGTGASNASDARTNLGLAIGSDVQAYNATLAAVAGGTYTGDDSIDTLGTVTTGTWSATTIALNKGGTGATTASDARSNLGLAIGSDVQAYNATLAAVAAGTYTGSSSITTLGTIGTGTWQGSAIANTYLPKLNGFTAPDGSVDLNSQKITSLATPTADGDAATKAYVDNAVYLRDVKDSVRTVSITAGAPVNVNISSPGAAIGGVSLSSGDRVLLVGQTTGSQNGIYVFNGASSAMTRALDADSSDKVTPNMYVWVEEGNAADTAWVLTTNAPITLGTTTLAFAKFSGLGQVTAGNGLTKTGDTLDVASANGGIVVNADNIALTLDGSTLSVGASGVKVASGGITTQELGAASVTAAKLATSVVASGGGLTGGAGTGLSVQFAMGEQLSGTVDGSNTSFSIANTPAGSKVMVFRNGLMQVAGGTDYTLSGTSVTFASAPASGDDLRAVYFY
jgi:hypothetical protein